MSDRTTTGQPPDVRRMSETLSTPCPSEGRQAGSKAGRQAGRGKIPHFVEDRAQSPATNATEQTIRLRSIDRLDALAVALADLRPDWDPSRIRATLARTPGRWRDVVHRAFLVTLDPETRHPERIENADLRGYNPTPRALTIAEAAALAPCPNGAFHTPHPCALCRAGITTEDA